MAQQPKAPEHTIEDLLEWCDEEYDARIHIKMGMQRTDGKKLPLAYDDGVVPTYNQFHPGRDADYEGGRTTSGKALWGIEDHKGSWKGFVEADKVHAVFPHLHPRSELLILDGAVLKAHP